MAERREILICTEPYPPYATYEVSEDASKIIVPVVLRGEPLTADALRRLRRLGVERSEAIGIWRLLRNRPELCRWTIKVVAPYIRCEVVKYFTVIVQNAQRTPPIRFEVRGEFTIPSEYAEQGEEETEEAWRKRFQNYLEDKIEPIMDDVLEKWGNQERVTVTLDGRTERWQNVLNLEDFSKSLPVTGVEKFEGTGTFKTRISFELVKVNTRTGRIALTDTYSRDITEGDLT